MRSSRKQKFNLFIIISIISTMFVLFVCTLSYGLENKDEATQTQETEIQATEAESNSVPPSTQEDILQDEDCYTITFTLPSYAHIQNDAGQTITEYKTPSKTTYYLRAQGNSLIVSPNLLSDVYFYLITDDTNYVFKGYPSEILEGPKDSDITIDLNNYFTESPEHFTLTGKLAVANTNEPISNLKVTLGRGWDPNTSNYSTYTYTTTNEEGIFVFNNINWKDFFDGFGDYLCVHPYPYDGYTTDVIGISSSRLQTGEYDLGFRNFYKWNVFVDGKEFHDHFTIQLTEAKFGNEPVTYKKGDAHRYGTFLTNMGEGEATSSYSYKVTNANLLHINIVIKLGNAIISLDDYEIEAKPQNGYLFDNWTYGSKILEPGTSGPIDLSVSDQFYANYKEAPNVEPEAEITAQTGDSSLPLVLAIISTGLIAAYIFKKEYYKIYNA